MPIDAQVSSADGLLKKLGNQLDDESIYKSEVRYVFVYHLGFTEKLWKVTAAVRAVVAIEEAKDLSLEYRIFSLCRSSYAWGMRSLLLYLSFFFSFGGSWARRW